MKAQIPWLRVFVEGVVIIGSILLAFGIQAWWEERGDGIRRGALLDALRSDMAVAAIEVDRVMGSHAEGREAAAALLNLGPEAPLSAGQAYLVDSLVAATFSSPSYAAPLCALSWDRSGGAPRSLRSHWLIQSYALLGVG